MLTESTFFFVLMEYFFFLENITMCVFLLNNRILKNFKFKFRAKVSTKMYVNTIELLSILLYITTIVLLKKVDFSMLGAQ